ncbi:MAG: translation elongation factor Ts, partial [Chromatiales bacterium]|nr:translation elongation factor Ts [Chromatiales bacterium]
CKKALVAAEGDLDVAAENMRKAGLAKADKKAGRVAAEGVVVVAVADDAKRAAIVEINSETDFVAGSADFRAFSDRVAAVALGAGAGDLDGLMAADMGDGSVEEARRALIAKVGENIGVRRFAVVSAEDHVGSYVHGSRIGVIVAMRGGDADLARDVAMHVAASKPQHVSGDDVPADVLAKEKEILSEQAKAEGKPEHIVEKMVEGRVKKFIAEITLLGQPFVKDPDITVERLLQDGSAEVISFTRFEVGEGIEKKADDFVAEVMAQVRGEA